MSNIWAFLVQTLTVSTTAALLLLLKRLLQDKLSPRWQYSVWCVLALRLVLPAPVNNYVLLPIPLWVEQLKTFAESGLSSAFSRVYTPVRLSHVLPVLSGQPLSITDWLFAVYAAGVILFALGYGISYLRLRLLLRRGILLEDTVLEPVCRRYGLKPCRVVAVDGLETAFVCGVFRPVMAVPAAKLPDEKVLLHELLHRKYLDPLQSILWTAARCLHWCNPFLQWVFCRIENDMESLCDQRVLELLEGEERREYGGILLDMASRRYARFPGTGSISNGAKNISRRIAAIVRFKKYPKGMTLVSVCMILMLLPPVLQGTAYAVSNGGPHSSDREWELALAETRLRRCTTVAGAIDTYGKGLLLMDVEYIATASPLQRQQELLMQGKEYGCYQRGAEFADVFTGEGFEIHGLRQQDEGYLCWLVYSLLAEDDQNHSLLIPLAIRQENGFWVAQEQGDRLVIPVQRDQLEFCTEDGPWVRMLFAQGRTGTVTVRRISIHQVENMHENGQSLGWVSTFDTDMKPNAQFSSVCFMDFALYECSEPDTPQQKVGICLEPMESPQAEITLPQTQTGTGGGGSSDGSYHQNLVLKEAWDGTLTAGNGFWIYGEEDTVPTYFKTGIYFDGELVEELIVQEVANEK